MPERSRRAKPRRSSASKAPVLVAAEPQLFVADVARSCEFYVTKLGFDVAFAYGDPPFYAQVARDGVALNLRRVDEPAIDPERRDRDELLAASIVLDDAEALFAAFSAASATFARTLAIEPWGARTFVVRDPDGNLILFAGRDTGERPAG